MQLASMLTNDFLKHPAAFRGTFQQGGRWAQFYKVPLVYHPSLAVGFADVYF